jgi:hypothetical protein
MKHDIGNLCMQARPSTSLDGPSPQQGRRTNFNLTLFNAKRLTPRRHPLKSINVLRRLIF